jgi:diaminopimelate decarboxylase
MVDQELTSLAEAYGTPFYLFDADMAKERIHTLQHLLPENVQLCYAIKANPFLVAPLKDEELLFEVCSSGELAICEKVGLNPKKIVFSGVVKKPEAVMEAYRYGVGTITLESLTQVSLLSDAIRDTNGPHHQAVILRLTSGNQFGMDEAELKTALGQVAQLSSVTVRGIHYFSGTQKKGKKIQEEISFITNFCDKLCSNGQKLPDIEYGSGFSYHYFGEGNSMADVEAFSSMVKDKPYRFVLELGRFIASPCGTYLSRIMDLKRNCVLIDGGINHISYYGQIMGMKHPPITLIKKKDTPVITNDLPHYTIYGSLCTTNDIIVKDHPLENPEVGDLLVFDDIGAYSVTEAMYLFLSHALPAVLVKEHGHVRQVRGHLETFSLNC